MSHSSRPLRLLLLVLGFLVVQAFIQGQEGGGTLAGLSPMLLDCRWIWTSRLMPPAGGTRISGFDVPTHGPTQCCLRCSSAWRLLTSPPGAPWRPLAPTPSL